MTTQPTRRAFLSDVGKGVLVSTLGTALAADLALANPDSPSPDLPARIDFGPLEPLVRLMQDTPPAKLLPALVQRLNSGTDLRTLVAAAALANARTFGGQDYVGYHTLMALAPAWRMSSEMPAGHAALPVLKVLYRNTSRMQETGGSAKETLHPLPAPQKEATAQAMRQAVRAKDLATAERLFSALSNGKPDELLEHVMLTVEDHTEVHRVVLPYRAWDLLDVVGREQAAILLRQSLRYCVQAENYSRPPSSPSDPRTLLPNLLEEHNLLSRTPGDRAADDKWVLDMTQTLFTSTPQQAASAAAAALADGISPSALGEALALAANQIVLRDPGRPALAESPGKPIGSVHGDSPGVHACDSANAWRNLARVGSPRNVFSCLILGAYQVALDRTNAGNFNKPDFTERTPLPAKYHLDRLTESDAGKLLADLESAIKSNLQARAATLTHRYGQLNHAPRPLFDLLLKYAVTEDGSLHAEKYYRTVSEEFAATRPTLRWPHLTALARVTASEYGRPAAGVAEAKELLNA
jgi:hypothetical protein